MPAHVHVFKADGEVVIDLGLKGKLPELKLNYRMSKQDTVTALLVVVANNEKFLRHWENIHGKINDN